MTALMVPLILQRKRIERVEGVKSLDVHSMLAALVGAVQTLDKTVRVPMDSGLGHSFRWEHG